MRYYALHNRNCITRTDGTVLTHEDLIIITAQLHPTDRFTESSTGIEVIGLSSEECIPKGYQWTPIRSLFATITADESFLLARAKALLEWRANARYCAHCGAALDDHSTLTARVCPECGKMWFPRIEPCIIVLVHRGNEILLARHVQRNQNIYACIAGFMEAGETAEQAVAREIMEETGILVKNIRYFGSQSWPFPSQLMLGFTAEYESGELRLQEDEIAEAAWFHRDELPTSPAPGSIAYRLIHESR